MQSDYDTDRKYCPTCGDYVPFLQSLEQSFCIQCGGLVSLFSEDDWTRFRHGLRLMRPLFDEFSGERDPEPA